MRVREPGGAQRHARGAALALRWRDLQALQRAPVRTEHPRFGFLRAKRHSSTGTGCSHAHRGPESAGVTCTRGSQDEGKNRVGREKKGPTARTGVTRTLPCFVGGEAVSESSAIERRDLAGLSRRDARSRRERAEHCLFDRKKKISRFKSGSAAQFALGLA